MVNLDQILDNDYFTPSQEREIRRLVNYKIERNHTNPFTGIVHPFVVSYTGKIYTSNEYKLHINSVSTQSRLLMHKSFLFKAIGDKAYQEKDPSIIKNAQLAIKEGICNSNENLSSYMYFGNNTKLFIPYYSEIKSQSLIKAFTLLNNVSK